jgi:hypothetical protein
MIIKHFLVDRVMRTLQLFFIPFCLYPLVFSPIHGDELISPFVFVSAYDGSFTNYLKAFSLEIDGHFNFLGEIIGIAWLSIWTHLFSEFNSIEVLHIAYYGIKSTCILSFILVAFLLSKSNGLHLKSYSHFILLLTSFSIVTIYHVNWSSDPVGNYPLVGYLSASLGGLFILLLSSNIKFKATSIFVLLLVAIFYYEMNLSLIGVLLYYLRNKITKRQIVYIATVLLTLSLVYQFILLTNDAYSGGEFLVSPKTFTSFLIQISSLFPLATLPLALYLSNWTFIVFTIYLFFAIIYISKFLSVIKNFFTGSWLAKIRKGMGTLSEVEQLLLVYFVISSLVFSLSDKYQSEIRLPGQVYMSYSTGQLFMVVLVARILSRHLENRTLLTNATVACLLLIPLIQNNLMVEVLETRTTYSQQLLESWKSKEEYRCEALTNWLSYDWDNEYLLAMKYGISDAYLKLNKEQFCSKQFTHPNRGGN